MRTHRLPHYLRACRKRVGLSQEDMAYLLGFESGAHVCRYERFRRSPGFRMALALCVIFQIPPRELFGGEYQKVERAIRKRAKRLAGRLAGEKPDQLTNRKLAFLRRIVAAEDKRP
jgi:transcriptional regulator with XRE-family HTH domain